MAEIKTFEINKTDNVGNVSFITPRKKTNKLDFLQNKTDPNLIHQIIL